jgi:Na+-transporting methylmalonyl-CoA/oxaloacetate decarboxylase gamma subunit
MEENKKPDHIGNTIVFILLSLLIYAGYLSYKSIDWTVLKRLESQTLILPTPIPVIPASPSAQIAPPSSSITR